MYMFVCVCVSMGSIETNYLGSNSNPASSWVEGLVQINLTMPQFSDLKNDKGTYTAKVAAGYINSCR